MIGDAVPSAPPVNLDPGVLRLRQQQYGLLEFVAEQLPCWRADDNEVLEQAEDRLTSQLSDYLDEAAHGSEAWNWVRFKTQVPDAIDKTRTLDIAAKPIRTVIIAERPYTRRSVLLPIECKRLPTPGGISREREYVVSSKGTTGGIQRFKLGKHALDHDLAVMIAYVQQGPSSDWVLTVNGWIQALAADIKSGWSEGDCLELISEGVPVYRLVSHHDRGSGYEPIELRHLWIDMN
ncbi:MAG: hypothetical protein EOP84_03945 [Verrucomicrobiaceae bacterium]|nr:MAG: hypothetical protein EOP84_03945 [Verrucomicrobiaceae bacterium]